MRHKSRKQQKSHQMPIRIQYNGMSNVGHIQDIRLKAKICTENAPSAKYYYQMTPYLPWMNDEKKRKRNSAEGGGEREKLRRKSVSFYCFIGFVSFSCNGEIKWLSSFSLFAISLVLMRRNFWGNSENSMPVRNSCACDFHFVYHHRIIKMYSYDLVYVLSYFFFLMNVLCFVLFFSPLLSIFFLFILILFDFHVADNFVVLSQHSLPDLICTWLFSTSFWMKLFFGFCLYWFWCSFIAFDDRALIVGYHSICCCSFFLFTWILPELLRFQSDIPQQFILSGFRRLRSEFRFRIINLLLSGCCSCNWQNMYDFS